MVNRALRQPEVILRSLQATTDTPVAVNPVRRVLLIHTLLFVIGAGHSQADTKKDTPLISIGLFGAGAIAGTMLARAESVTARILGPVGIRVRWEDRDIRHAAVERIDIRFANSTTDQSSRFATSLPFASSGVRIIIFVNRIQAAGNHDLLFTSRLLGHVLAHEIGHVLMRTDQHSPQGVMKERWTEDDYAEIRRSYLMFTDENVTAILAAIAAEEHRAVGPQ